MNYKNHVAILFVHGILGTPKHFDPFMPFVPPNWTICNILLKGHCGSVSDFSRASMSEWKKQVSLSLDELLKDYDQVIVVAHSMGTLFAIQEAIEKPIAGLFLLNVPLKVRVTARLFSMAWKIYWGNIDPKDEWILAAQKAYGIERDHHILRYLGWIPRYFELFAEIKKTRRVARNLSTPSNVYLSLQDEMVSLKSSEYFKNNTRMALKTLNNSGHFYYSPEDQSLLNEEFKEMIRNVIDSEKN